MVHIEMPTGGDDAKGVGISHSDASLSQDKSKEDTVKRPLSVTMGTWSLPRKGEDMWDTRECKVGGEKLFIALVADGHGGTDAALHCKRTVIENLIAAAGNDPSPDSLRAACKATFVRAHSEVLKMLHTTAGTTLTVCIVNPLRCELTTAHVGDSVARMVPARGDAVALCEDHRIDSSPVERDRLIGMGGKIARATDSFGQPAGPMRLWPGGVAQARAIGDRDVGSFIDARPAVQTQPISERGACILVCSDGVWDALIPTMVDAMVRTSRAVAPQAIARLVCTSSLTQRHAYANSGDLVPRDDTTCIAISIARARERGTPRTSHITTTNLPRKRPIGCVPCIAQGATDDEL